MKREYYGITIDDSRNKLLTAHALDLLENFYMLDFEESPQETFARAATAFCYQDYALAQRIYDYVSTQHMMFSSPILSNAPLGKWVNDEFVYTYKNKKAMPIACFTKDTLVKTNNGYKSIKDITIGDMVLSSNGKYNRVSATKESKSDDLYELIVENTRHVVTGTHLIKTEEDGWVEAQLLDSDKHTLIQVY